MPMNPIQFQRGMPLPEFFASYGTEAQCEATLAHARWPHGFRCPACGYDDYTPVQGGKQRLYQCRACRHQASLRAGTVFESSKLPLRIWFLAIYLMTQSKNNVAALELKRTLGVAYSTAWLLKHKLMRVMTVREQDRVLSGRVEADDAYLGGAHAGKRGRGAEGKVPMVIAVQTHVAEETAAICPDYVRLDPLPDFTNKTLATWAERRLAAETLFVSDGLAAFVAAGAQVNHHQRVVVGVRKSSDLDCFHWVNTLLSNLKSAIQGTYHGFGFRKYAHRYLGEVQYRFNRRFDMAAMIPRMITACVQTPPLNEKRMRLAEVSD
jgi:transposase-like protein